MKVYTCESDYIEIKAQLSSVNTYYHSIQNKIDINIKDELDRKQKHVDEIHELNININDERRLVLLTKEICTGIEDRHNDVVREIQTLQKWSKRQRMSSRWKWMKLKKNLRRSLKFLQKKKCYLMLINYQKCVRI